MLMLAAVAGRDVIPGEPWLCPVLPLLPLLALVKGVWCCNSAVRRQIIRPELSSTTRPGQHNLSWLSRNPWLAVKHTEYCIICYLAVGWVV